MTWTPICECEHPMGTHHFYETNLSMACVEHGCTCISWSPAQMVWTP